MPTLLPFRQYDEHDVFNGFAYSGSLPVNKGTFVRPVASGWRTDENDWETLAAPGASFPGTWSFRYGTIPKVTAAGTGDYAIGMLLYDIAETDENGEKYIYRRQKADEAQVVLSGQTVPITTRGYFLWSGTLNGAVTVGLPIYPSGNGDLTVNSINQNVKLGRLVGMPNGRGHSLIYVNVL